APLVLGQLRLVVRVLPRRLDRLNEADALVGRAVGRLGALFGGVLEAQLERVHADAPRELVDHALDRECGDRRAWRSIGSELRPIAHHIVADDAHVFELVARESRHGAHVHERAWKGATLKLQLGIAGGKTPILRDTYLDAHRARRGRAAGP